jgi:predicted enzyme related to lactoylglutathione lyase
MDWKIELIPLAVEDVDRSVEFYRDKVGWNIDHDQTVHEGLRFVQVTPPGSACSICFGVGLDMMPEGSKQVIQIVIDSAEEARDHLRGRGVECTDVDEQPWGRFVFFADPDGNTWALQQLPSWAPQLATQETPPTA